MAYYNINRLVALTRKAKRISQEELCDGICSTVALSDYENGKYGIRRKKYRKLMQRMGRISSVNYAVCMDKDGGLLEDRIQMERAFKRYDYEAAEKYLVRLKNIADDNVLTQQYLARAEALVDYYRKRIQVEELIERLDRAIKMTVPEYEVYLGRTKRVFPFVKEELGILMSLGNAYRCAGKTEESILLHETVLRSLREEYLGNPDRVLLEILTNDSYSLVLDGQHKNEEALIIQEECLRLAIQNDYGPIVPILLVGMVHNIRKLKRRQESDGHDFEKTKKKLRQAYYIAAAREDNCVMLTIEEYYRKLFKENLSD